MSGLKTSLAAFALLALGNGGVSAQEPVPGGWSTQFGYQTLGGAGVGFGPGAGMVGLGGGGYGYGYGGYPMAETPNGFGASSLGLGSPIPQTGYAGGSFLGVVSGRPQTSMSTDPLVGVISKSVRRSKRR